MWTNEYALNFRLVMDKFRPHWAADVSKQLDLKL